MRFKVIFVMATIFSFSDKAPLNSVSVLQLLFWTYYCIGANCLRMEPKLTCYSETELYYDRRSVSQSVLE
jgi:hypothetical protein